VRGAALGNCHTNHEKPYKGDTSASLNSVRLVVGRQQGQSPSIWSAVDRSMIRNYCDAWYPCQKLLAANSSSKVTEIGSTSPNISQCATPETIANTRPTTPYS
jgi:hypothetical protein